jgi:hypothetical protein
MLGANDASSHGLAPEFGQDYTKSELDKRRRPKLAAGYFDLDSLPRRTREPITTGQQ